MIFEREGAQPIVDPSEQVLERELRKLRSYGASTFASLTKDDGSYLQTAGGGVACMLERHDIEDRHYRAWQDPPVMPPEFDGSTLVFGGGSVVLARREWFRNEQIIEAFNAFRKGEPLPAFIRWRDITEMLFGKASDSIS